MPVYSAIKRALKFLSACFYIFLNDSMSLYNRVCRNAACERGSIIISRIGNGRLKGEFKVDDGYVKVNGPFEMDFL